MNPQTAVPVEKASKAQRRGREAYVGRRYARLLVVDYKPSGANHHPRLVCLCACGRTVDVFSTNLTRGLTKSCGCLNDEARVVNNTTHGMSLRSEYSVWQSMLQRCTNPQHIAYKNYGGRGVIVCGQWLSFSQFIADMGHRPSANHTLDRFPNNDGNYEPSNCRWATFTEQARNRRSNRLITLNGQTKTLAEWSVETGLNASTINRRLDLYGYTPEEALTKPLFWRGR